MVVPSNFGDDDDHDDDDDDDNNDDDDPTQARAGCAQVRGRLH